MNKYDVLLLDVDDTLLDFKANEYISLEEVFKAQNYTLNDDIRKLYGSINKKLWEEYEQGKVSRDTVVNTRFEKLFEVLGVKVNGEELEYIYRESLGNGAQLIDGALDICKDLSKSHQLCVVTNGVFETQIKRLKASGLYTYMNDIFISDFVGHQKPSKEFFDYVFKELGDIDLSRVIIIGDSLSSDIQGGINAGISTCFFNKDKVENKTSIKPTYEVDSLEDILNIV